MLLEPDVLHLYTDGSSLNRPRRGGYAARLVYMNEFNDEEFVDYDYSGVPGATNNQMELKACIAGIEKAIKFEHLHKFYRITCYTDSMYIVNHYSQAIHVWPKRQWMTSSNEPVQNVDLWKELVSSIKKISALGKRIDIQWVKGHSMNLHNKAVDRLARIAAKSCVGKPKTFSTIRKKQFSENSKSELLNPAGKRFTIKIYNSVRLKQQRLFKHKYEVITKKSMFYKYCGTVYSEDALRTRNSYSVTISLLGNRIERIHRIYKSKD